MHETFPAPNARLPHEPHEAARRAEVDELGLLLHTQRAGVNEWGATILIGLLAGAIATAVTFEARRRGNMAPPLIQNLAVGVPVALVAMLVLSWPYGLFRRIEVREHGLADWRRGRLKRVIRFEDCESVRSTVVQYTSYGIDLGKRVSVRVTDAAGRRVKWSCKYEESMQVADASGDGARTVDPSMAVVDTVARIIAANWVERMRAGESILWCRALRLTPLGIEFTKGKRRSQPVRYAELDRIWFDNGHLTMFFSKDQRQKIKVDHQAENLWPGFILLESACCAKPA